ncbi:DUF6265 family protein [Flavobacterium hiemivividum]|uniref:DUF6265 domain-containing protein n=1 Tax=Flavobacterium hiemivividum TaxID=2541734 RepID=A0A4R5CLJ7_9FLAO|nr:DUF6265 family protein [Flavobacterium hiemivividum]TDE00816.1 hypothetical protein E0F98_15780 [Flavobacterium hiemivividum]
MYKKITFLVLITIFVSCKKTDSDDPDQNEKDIIKTARWLQGQWENKSEDGTLTETWKKVNDSTYNGHSFFLKGKDTIHYETIVLQQIEEQLSYNANVRGQNDDKPVAFLLTETKENQLVFENPTHDYPQKISYTQVSKDSLVAEISGIQSGKPSSEKYVMLRTK